MELELTQEEQARITDTTHKVQSAEEAFRQRVERPELGS